MAKKSAAQAKVVLLNVMTDLGYVAKGPELLVFEKEIHSPTAFVIGDVYRRVVFTLRESPGQPVQVEMKSWVVTNNDSTFESSHPVKGKMHSELMAELEQARAKLESL